MNTFSILILLVVLASFLYVVYANLKNDSLAHRVADALLIPSRFVPYLKDELLGVFKNQPELAIKFYGKGYMGFYILKSRIVDFDNPQYQLIMDKFHLLVEQEEELWDGISEGYNSTMI